MKHLKRSWLPAIPIVVALACLLLWTYRPIPAPAVPESADTSATALDVVSYSRVQALRDELCLTNRDLAAMGMAQAEAERTLNALVAWWAQNERALNLTEQRTAEVQRDRADLMRRANIGPADRVSSADVNALHLRLASAAIERKNLSKSAQAAVAAAMPASAIAVFEAALSNGSLPERFRYVPNVTREETKQLMQLLVENKPEAEVAAGIDHILGVRASQAREVAVRAEAAMAAVIAAEAQVLPVPERLRARVPTSRRSG